MLGPILLKATGELNSSFTLITQNYWVLQCSSFIVSLK